MATNVYIDGFNLYNGMFKRGRTPASAKWLDLALMAATVWPALVPINRTRYFTARLKPLPNDPQMPNRQAIYLRAVIASGVEVSFGQFKLRDKTWLLDGNLVQRPPSLGAALLKVKAKVCKYDEKGSDVNLASYLLRDAALGDCTTAIVVSNDTDLVEAINITQADFGVPVYVINPHLRQTSELQQVATDVRQLSPATVIACSLAAIVTEANGTKLTKPPTWI